MGPMVATALAILYTPPLWRARGQRIRLASVVTIVIAAGVLTSILSSYTGQSLAGYAASVVTRSVGNLRAAVQHVSDPSRLRRQWEEARAAVRREVPIPVQMVEGSVDVYPHRQDVVFAYDLAYRPRPVISSLVATSAVLADLNAKHLGDPASAARTLLFDVELVDRNFPTMLDGRSLPELLTLYDVVDASGGMLVLRRSATPRTYRFTPVARSRTRFDELTQVPSAGRDPLWVNFHFKRRLAGKVLSILYKPPTLGIEVHTRGTEPRSYRLLPSLAEEQGFLLSPLIPDRQSYAALASDGTSASALLRQQVTALKVFVADASPELYFDDEIEIELNRLEIEPRR
jgi:hypothetical protein